MARAGSGTGSAVRQPAKLSLAKRGRLRSHITVARPEYEEMLRRVSELEATAAKLPLPPSTPGIGHNHPPPPLETTELDEIKQEISRLKAQPPPPPAEASKTASKFIRHGTQVLLWFGKKLDTFIDEFTKAVGKTAGLAMGALPIWLTF